MTNPKQEPSSMGEVIFLRSDSPDFEEHSVQFTSLDALVEICSRVQPGFILDKVWIHTHSGKALLSLAFDFVATSKRPLGTSF